MFNAGYLSPTPPDIRDRSGNAGDWQLDGSRRATPSQFPFSHTAVFPFESTGRLPGAFILTLSITNEVSNTSGNAMHGRYFSLSFSTWIFSFGWQSSLIHKTFSVSSKWNGLNGATGGWSYFGCTFWILQGRHGRRCLGAIDGEPTPNVVSTEAFSMYDNAT